MTGFGLKGLNESQPLRRCHEASAASDVNRLAARASMVAARGSCGAVWVYDQKLNCKATLKGQQVEGFALEWSHLQAQHVGGFRSIQYTLYHFLHIYVM